MVAERCFWKNLLHLGPEGGWGGRGQHFDYYNFTSKRADKGMCSGVFD